jgi:hypothetical protein
METVYRDRISVVPHAVLPIMPISPTKMGGMNEIKTFL